MAESFISCHSKYCTEYYYIIIIAIIVCSTDYTIICLSEIWLNDLCYDHNFFPVLYTVYSSDGVFRCMEFYNFY
jgi:hypothetical protein